MPAARPSRLYAAVSVLEERMFPGVHPVPEQSSMATVCEAIPATPEAMSFVPTEMEFSGIENVSTTGADVYVPERSAASVDISELEELDVPLTR